MEIKSISAFLSYYEKTRQATMKIIQVIPQEKIDWSYKQGKFTIGDLVRHIAAIERWIFAEVAQGNKPAYRGCGRDIADGYDQVVAYFNRMSEESVQIFKSIKDENLTNYVKTLDGKEIELGNFLRALFLHEIHHRGALCIYLNLLNVETPPIIGLKEEQVKQLSWSR